MEIIDEKNWLSKRQRTKIREFLTDHEFNKSKILDMIEYRIDEGKYTNVFLENNKIIFSTIDRNALRKKLRDKINNMKGNRAIITSEAWKKYYQLTNISQLRGIKIPDPNEVIKNKEQFEMVKNMDKTGWFKQYIECCLMEEQTS